MTLCRHIARRQRSSKERREAGERFSKSSAKSSLPLFRKNFLIHNMKNICKINKISHNVSEPTQSNSMIRRLCHAMRHINVEPVIFMTSATVGLWGTTMPLFFYWSQCFELFGGKVGIFITLFLYIQLVYLIRQFVVFLVGRLLGLFCSLPFHNSLWTCGALLCRCSFTGHFELFGRKVIFISDLFVHLC